MSIWQIVLTVLVGDFALCVLVGKAIARGQAHPAPLQVHVPDSPAELFAPRWS